MSRPDSNFTCPVPKDNNNVNKCYSIQDSYIYDDNDNQVKSCPDGQNCYYNYDVTVQTNYLDKTTNSPRSLQGEVVDKNTLSILGITTNTIASDNFCKMYKSDNNDNYRCGIGMSDLDKVCECATPNNS